MRVQTTAEIKPLDIADQLASESYSLQGSFLNVFFNSLWREERYVSSYPLHEVLASQLSKDTINQMKVIVDFYNNQSA